jgi:tetratricopeptide (TPR) repeat protein
MAKVSLRAYNREIETMIDRGQLDEAIAHCRHILKTYPKHLETYRLLGKAYLEYKRYGDAADIFSRILVSVPNDFVAQVGMSIIRDEENKLDDAIWHMERAFETQPSNPAIQSELQRLYGRRDGVRPPRIRMTRGALAHMYVQGELYPQAISEIKSVLQEDAGRADMQALLARACYKSGLKNEAADVASALLRRYPYSFDANRVLVEILGSEHPESTQLYRQRVFELDPYAALIAGNIFLSGEVSDAAVNIERLDWNGQPVAMQPDWGETKAISLESGSTGAEQPDWLNRPPEEAPRLDDSALGPSQPTPAPIFESTAPYEQPPAQPADDIPDFMRAAGWGESTGSFNESKPAFSEEESKPAESIEQGDLPDWVKAMKPAEAEPPLQEDEKELPDWISNIGAGALASQTGEQPDLLGHLEQPSEAHATGDTEQTDWRNQLESDSESTPAGDLSGELDWLKKVGEAEASPESDQADELDWMKNLGGTEAVPSTSEADELDWMKDLSFPEPTASEKQAEESDWLKGLGDPESISSSAGDEQPEWLKGLVNESESGPDVPEGEKPGRLGSIGEETEPSTPAPSASDFDFLNQLTEEPILETPPESTPSTVDVENLGVSEQERDDSFAWLEGLAAKQGATEGLLTKPEERLEEEPEWVKQAKGLKRETPATETPAEQPPASLEDLGRSEQDQDDSFAWLENLAAKQGAKEGLLTPPEERLEQEPEWVKQAKDLSAQEPPASIMPEPELEQLASMPEPEPELEQPVALSEPEPMAEPEQPAPVDEIDAWLKDLEGEEKPSEPAAAVDEPEPVQPAAAYETDAEPSAVMSETEDWLKSLDEEEKTPGLTAPVDETAMWLKNLDEKEPEPVEPQPVEATDADLPAWMKNIEEEETPAAEATVPASETELEATWMPPAEESRQQEPIAEPEPQEEESLPSWLNELDKEEEQIATPSDGGEDLPTWLRADESALETPEPTLSTDWKPAEEIQAEPSFEQPEPTPLPPASFDIPEEETIEEDQQVQAEPEPTPVMEMPGTPPEADTEPDAPPATGVLGMPAVDPVLGSARSELSNNNISGALESYGKLVRKARLLDEVIYDLREALYRYPVDVNIWQSLGDAYMRANRLQDALDAYTKAEELLR